MGTIDIKFCFGKSLIFSHVLNFWHVKTLYVLIRVLIFLHPAIKAFDMLIFFRQKLHVLCAFFFEKSLNVLNWPCAYKKNECTWYSRALVYIFYLPLTSWFPVKKKIIVSQSFLSFFKMKILVVFLQIKKMEIRGYFKNM